MTSREASAEQLREVAEAIRASDIPRAVALARGHLDGGFVHPMFLNLRSYWHEREGRLLDAFADLEAARQLAPADPVILNAYGLCATRLGRREEALAAFEAAVAADASFAPAHFNAGWASEGLGELDRAKAHYLKAIAISPSAAEALSSLAWLSARTGQWEEARRAATQALAIAPDRPIPHLAIATADLNTGNPSDAEQRVRKVLAHDSLSRIDRGIALGLLGDCLDRSAAYDEAFRAYTHSNDLFRDEYEGQVTGTSSESVVSMIGWLDQYFSRTARRWPSVGAASLHAGDPVGHVFLVGFPRSGTTLLEQVLASHPDVVTSNETELLSEPVREYMRSPATLDRLRDAGASELHTARQKYWERVRAHTLDPAGKVFVDKLPLNTIKLPIIARLFPGAKILVALRDPRDVVWGCFRQRFQMNASMLEFTSLQRTARFYDACMTLLATYRTALPLAFHTIRHEDLLRDFDGEVRQVCGFIGVPWDETMRSFAEKRHERSVSTPSGVQVARGLYASGGQWKRYEAHLQPILPLVQPWVERFGYAGA